VIAPAVLCISISCHDTRRLDLGRCQRGVIATLSSGFRNRTRLAGHGVVQPVAEHLRRSGAGYGGADGAGRGSTRCWPATVALDIPWTAWGRWDQSRRRDFGSSKLEFGHSSIAATWVTNQLVDIFHTGELR